MSPALDRWVLYHYRHQWSPSALQKSFQFWEPWVLHQVYLLPLSAHESWHALQGTILVLSFCALSRLSRMVPTGPASPLTYTWMTLKSLSWASGPSAWLLWRKHLGGSQGTKKGGHWINGENDLQNILLHYTIMSCSHLSQSQHGPPCMSLSSLSLALKFQICP